MVSGIYCIRNKINGDMYIGGSQDIENRIKQHFTYFKAGKHKGRHFQHEFNKFGIDNFEAMALIICDVDSIQYFEDACIKRCSHVTIIKEKFRVLHL